MGEMEECTCPTCKGFKKIICPICNGHGRVTEYLLVDYVKNDPCTECGTSGWIACRDCSGTGRVYRESRDEDDAPARYETGGDDYEDDDDVSYSSPVSTSGSTQSAVNTAFGKFIGTIALCLFALYLVSEMFSGPPTQRTASRQQHFVPFGGYPNPSPPPPISIAGHTAAGELVINWRGRQWVIPLTPGKEYKYVCLINGIPTGCWVDPPNPAAEACTRNNVPGWCW